MVQSNPFNTVLMTHFIALLGCLRGLIVGLSLHLSLGYKYPEPPSRVSGEGFSVTWCRSRVGRSSNLHSFCAIGF